MYSIFTNDRLRLSITDSCNLMCNYCTNEGQLHNYGNYLSLDFINRLYKKIVSEGIFVRKINITGGEPLLHPDLIQIIKMSKDVCNSITLNTNGILLTEEMVEKYCSVGLTNIKFGVDSFSQNITKPSLNNDFLIKSNVIDRIMFTTKLMPRSSVNIVLTEFNFSEVDEIISSILINRIDKVEFLELINHGFRNSVFKRSQPVSIIDIIVKHKYMFKKIEYNPKLAKFICHTKDNLLIQFAEDFCKRRVCQNLWTRINSKGQLLPCIKDRKGIEIDFSKNITEQIIRSNRLMCNFAVDWIPRDYEGKLLPLGIKGDYIKPIFKSDYLIDGYSNLDL